MKDRRIFAQVVTLLVDTRSEPVYSNGMLSDDSHSYDRPKGLNTSLVVQGMHNMRYMEALCASAQNSSPFKLHSQGSLERHLDAQKWRFSKTRRLPYIARPRGWALASISPLLGETES